MGVLSLNKSMLMSPGFVDKALQDAEQLLEQGAAIIEISCRSTREEVGSLSVDEEIALIGPVIEVICKRVNVPVSIGTGTPLVMEAAVRAGAAIIDDIHALTKVSALQTAAQLHRHVCLVHMYSDPVTKQLNTSDNDIVSIVYNYLEQRITDAVNAGIEARKIIIDPGFGFGKSLPQNLSLLRQLHVFKKLHCPILVDLSHNSMVGQILNTSLDKREYGNIAAEIIAISRGADIIRSHNVQASADALKVLKALGSS